MKKKNIIKFLALQFSRRDPIFQKLMGPRTPFWKCLAPTLYYTGPGCYKSESQLSSYINGHTKIIGSQ